VPSKCFPHCKFGRRNNYSGNISDFIEFTSSRFLSLLSIVFWTKLYQFPLLRYYYHSNNDILLSLPSILCCEHIFKNSIFIKMFTFKTWVSIYLSPLIPTSSFEIPSGKSIAARDNEDRRKSDVCTDYEWRQCAVTSMREACVRLVTHRLPAPRGVFTPE